jgi:hypothetical protein
MPTTSKPPHLPNSQPYIVKLYAEDKMAVEVEVPNGDASRAKWYNPLSSKVLVS